MGGNQSFSSQMEKMNDRFIVVLEHKFKVVDFVASVIFVAVKLGVVESIAGSIFTKFIAICFDWVYSHPELTPFLG